MNHAETTGNEQQDTLFMSPENFLHAIVSVRRLTGAKRARAEMALQVLAGRLADVTEEAITYAGAVKPYDRFNPGYRVLVGVVDPAASLIQRGVLLYDEEVEAWLSGDIAGQAVQADQTNPPLTT